MKTLATLALLLGVTPASAVTISISIPSTNSNASAIESFVFSEMLAVAPIAFPPGVASFTWQFFDTTGAQVAQATLTSP